MQDTHDSDGTHDPADSITYRIDADLGVVFITMRGEITFAALAALQDAYLSDPLYREGMAQYVDCRVVTSIPSSDAIRRLALDRLLMRAMMPTGRVAIVVMTRLGMDYASAWELFSDAPDGSVAVFTAHSQARAWLGLPSSDGPD